MLTEKNPRACLQQKQVAIKILSVRYHRTPKQHSIPYLRGLKPWRATKSARSWKRFSQASGPVVLLPPPPPVRLRLLPPPGRGAASASGEFRSGEDGVSPHLHKRKTPRTLSYAKTTNRTPRVTQIPPQAPDPSDKDTAAAFLEKATLLATSCHTSQHICAAFIAPTFQHLCN